MRDAWPDDRLARETAAGINALEGYLLWQSETARAAERAAVFADGLPWLTGGQREEVERAYVGDYLDHAEDALRATAARIEQLRSEYRAAYRALSKRLTGAFVVAMGLVVGVSAVLSVLGG